MKSAVVVVHYRTEQMTLDCLASLQEECAANPGSDVWLVDNASGDGSRERIQQEIQRRGWDSWVTCLTAESNRGFSYGNNLAIRAALANGPQFKREPYDAFLLLNSDTLVRPGCLAKLTKKLASDKQLGLVGPRLEWPGGELQHSCFRYISPLSELLSSAKTGPLTRLLASREVLLDHPPADQTPIEWISFACVMIRREVFETVGMMDEDYFMYFEDVDYCRRAREQGWKIAWEPAARVVHLRGGTTPETFEEKEQRRRPRYYYASRSRYLTKYYGRGGPCTANLLWWAGRSVSLLREFGGRESRHIAEREPFDIWIDCFRGINGTGRENSGRHCAGGPASSPQRSSHQADEGDSHGA